MSEWFKEPVLKTGDSERGRGFESHLLRLLTLGEVPKWLKGLPWKGSRSLIAMRGFKSHLLRLDFNKLEKSFLKSCWQATSYMIRYNTLTAKKLLNKRLSANMNNDNWTIKQPWKFLNEKRFNLNHVQSIKEKMFNMQHWNQDTPK